METCHASGNGKDPASDAYKAHKNVIGQGLDGGMITDQDIDTGAVVGTKAKKGGKLTVRDATVLTTVIKLMESGFAAIAMQELSLIHI